MDNAVDNIEINRVDLQSIRDALNVAYYFSVSDDLQIAYRALKANPKWSPLTNQLKRALDHCDSLLVIEEIEDVEIDDEDAEDDDSVE